MIFLVFDVVLFLNLVFLCKILLYFVGVKFCFEMLISFLLIVMFNGGLEFVFWLWIFIILVIVVFVVSVCFGVVCVLFLIVDVVIFYFVMINGFEFFVLEMGVSYFGFIVLGLMIVIVFFVVFFVFYECFCYCGEYVCI